MVGGLVTAPELDGLYGDIPELEYHADKGSLSSSGARQLLATSPAEFKFSLTQPPETKRVYDYGSACHKMVLGTGQELVVIDADSYQTKAAREQRDEAWAAGSAPILKREMEAAQEMAGALYRHRLAAALLSAGVAEMSGWWTDPETGVRLRFRPDFIRDIPGQRPVVVDYKTTTDAHPRKFAKSMADFGYHCQGDWYLTGFAATAGITDAVFVLISQGKKPPYPVSVHQVDSEDLARGRFLNRKAIRVYAQCLDSGRWPGHEELNVLSLPGWERHNIDEQIAMEGEM